MMHVMNDLSLAAESITFYGIVVVDDFLVPPRRQ
jgi:hypothetical protein